MQASLQHLESILSRAVQLRKEGRVNKLFQAVRQTCSAANWSRGVELVRHQGVVQESHDLEQNHITLRALGRRGQTAILIELWPDDAEWSCECDSPDDACQHVAAAVIAMRQPSQNTQKTGSTTLSSPAARLEYHLKHTLKGLRLEKHLVHGDSHEIFQDTTASLLNSTDAHKKVVILQSDLRLDSILGIDRNRAYIPPGRSAQIFNALAACEHIFLDAKRINIGLPHSGLCLTVDDHPEGFWLKLKQSAKVDELFTNAIIQRGSHLHALVKPELSPNESQALRAGKLVRHSEVAYLTQQIIAKLQNVADVELRCKTPLPQTRAMQPRVVFQTSGTDTQLTVLPVIVYGDPACARLDGDRLTHLQGQVPKRQPKLERQLENAVHAQLGLSIGIPQTESGTSAIALSESLRQWDATLEGHGHERFFITTALQPQIEANSDGSVVIYFASEADSDQPSSGDQRVGAETVLAAWQHNEALIPLSEGGWAPLPQDWLKRCGPMLADLLQARLGSESMPACLAHDAMALVTQTYETIPIGFQHLRHIVDQFEKVPVIQLPDDLQATLRPYQRTAIDWLAFLKEQSLGALLADDMGLGKTLQALSVMPKGTLVVAPTSVLPNWSEELARFRPHLKVQTYHGQRRSLDSDADITLTSYALLRLDLNILQSKQWEMVVLDEAQAIKNPKSQVARAAYQIQAKFRLAMSGTPVENRLSELWSQFHFLNPALLGSLKDFEQRYAKPIAQGNQPVAEHLRRRLKPFYMRRLKKEVAKELPERTVMVTYCEQSADEKALYDAIAASTHKNIVDKVQAGANVMAMFEALLRLRQAACHPSLIPGQIAPTSSKVERLIEHLNEAISEGHKALIFSQWTSMLDLIEPHLKANNIPWLRLDGSTRDRGAVVENFQGNDGPPVLLLSLKAGGTGLNLTAADHVMMVDPWWNPAVEDQAADRAHRIGQKRPVIIHRLISRGTVEEKILKLQDHKRQLGEQALGQSSAGALTRDDLLGLLGADSPAAQPTDRS